MRYNPFEFEFRVGVWILLEENMYRVRIDPTATVAGLLISLSSSLKGVLPMNMWVNHDADAWKTVMRFQEVLALSPPIHI